ncbi:MAG: BrnA antitoxin family protein [bacterium]|nr:BrnA antitoxin family protein [bacterium]
MKKIKPIPKFKSEDDEREFWATHSAVDYFDMDHPLNVSFPNLKLSTKTITIRVPESLLEDLKTLANKMDIPYQSLMKKLLIDKVKEEFRSYRT